MKDPYVRVRKAMYGLPSAGFDFARYTHDKIVNVLGYTPISGFPSMYTKIVEDEIVILGFYVDDLYMTGDLQICRSEMKKISQIFTLGTINDSQNFKFLGIERVTKPEGQTDHMIPYVRRIIAEYKQIVGIGVA